MEFRNNRVAYSTASSNFLLDLEFQRISIAATSFTNNYCRDAATLNLSQPLSASVRDASFSQNNVQSETANVRVDNLVAGKIGEAVLQFAAQTHIDIAYRGQPRGQGLCSALPRWRSTHHREPSM